MILCWAGCRKDSFEQIKVSDVGLAHARCLDGRCLVILTGDKIWHHIILGDFRRGPVRILWTYLLNSSVRGYELRYAALSHGVLRLVTRDTNLKMGLRVIILLLVVLMISSLGILTLHCIVVPLSRWDRLPSNLAICIYVIARHRKRVFLAVLLALVKIIESRHYTL